LPRSTQSHATQIGRPSEVADAFARAIGLAEDTAVREFLIAESGS
jgi:predicted RNA polymerase sigma factor